MTDFTITETERRRLEWLIAHTHDARQILRAYALLWLDDGDSIPEIAARLKVTRQTVYNWAMRFQSRAEVELSARLADGARSARPCTARGIIDPLIDAVIDSDPRDYGYHSTVWTASLLVIYLRDEHHLIVSDDSVRDCIARLHIRWKRPRHRLAPAPADVASS